jgi:hypothetical protein
MRAIKLLFPRVSFPWLHAADFWAKHFDSEDRDEQQAARGLR